MTRNLIISANAAGAVCGSVPQGTPSPHPNSGLPEFGTIKWSKSETSDFDWGEGWGEGVTTAGVCMVFGQ